MKFVKKLTSDAMYPENMTSEKPKKVLVPL